MIPKTLKAALICVTVATPLSANDDFVKGLIGGIVGAAIVNGAKAQPSKTQRSTGSVVSSAQRIENKGIQEALNYFGFNAGSPDGILGRKTTQAVSQMQACLGYQITGKLNSFEQQFLSQSYFKAQAGGNETLRLVASMPNGYCGVLQKYLADLTKPGSAVAVTASAAPVPTTAATNTRTNVVVNQAAQSQNVTVNNTEVIQTNIATVYVNSKELQQEFDRLVTQLKLLAQISEHVRAKASDDESRKKLSAITKRITELEKLVKSYERESRSKYGVPIKPSNANLGVTAAKASEVFPRVPYYIPGTDEVGEMWIKPYVSNGGELLYDFNFVDKTAEFGKIKDTIVLSANNIGTVSTALVKVNEWSDKALEKNLRRRFEKSAACFPQEMCGKREAGKTSTEVVFMLYEDGSTSTKIQQNKGKFQSGYNVSVESGLLLSAYADYMIDIGSKEFMAATMTDEELDAEFN
ncbi:peptidoglycan-binding protein [Planktomarina temperata]|nr:peptidoglycan-binding protein [Planktomarina temperata]